MDLFCGVGGLTNGLARAGIKVAAGIDVDDLAAYAYQKNNPGSIFIDQDVAELSPATVKKLLGKSRVRLLAGCAPCQPFSKLTNGQKDHEAWDLLDYFGLLVSKIKPELVTMENVPELAVRGKSVFDRFLKTLKGLDYHVDWRVVNCQEFGVPQSRTRLVLLASRLGPISIPKGPRANPRRWKTVKSAISRLPKVRAGESHPADMLHVAPLLSPINMERMKHTPANGGSWKSWPKRLMLDCHKKESGKKYVSIYGRMWWNKPAPTMTTLCTGIGNGRFGHPAQHRAITLREAAILQSFPKNYDFWPPKVTLNKTAVSRHIGNAVPPALAKFLGKTLVKHVKEVTPRK